METQKTDSIYTYLDLIIPKINQPVIFELGAHDGSDTIKILKRCQSHPKYYAFEPDTRNYNVLIRQKRPYMIQTYPVAVSNFDGQTHIYQSSGRSPKHPPAYNHTASSSIRVPNSNNDDSWLKYNPSPKKVSVCKLDTFCANKQIDHIDFIWSDIQGSEGDMIDGAKEILTKTKFLYMECLDTEIYIGMKTTDQLLEMLPDYWNVVHKFEYDILLENTSI